MASTPYQQYLETNVNTAPPGQLVVMLYDALLTSLRLTQQAMLQGEVASAERSRQKAIAILEELMSTLNLDAGEIANNLLSLYEFSLQQILQSQLKGEPNLMDGPILVLSTLREAWASLATAAARSMPLGAAVGVAGQA